LSGEIGSGAANGAEVGEGGGKTTGGAATGSMVSIILVKSFNFGNVWDA
jgi:hypothetical protein